MSKKKNIEFVNSLLLAVGFIVFVLAFIIYNANDKKPDVLIKKAEVDRGVITVPAEVRVTASASKIWSDGRPSTAIIILLLIIGGFTQMAYAAWKGFGADGEKDNKYIAVLLLSWVFSCVFLFAGSVKRVGSSDYEARLTMEQYEANKDNLDALFPESNPKP